MAARTRHPDPVFGRRTAARASVPQPVHSYPRARVRHPDPVFGHTARSRVRTTHGSAGVGPAARAFPPSSSRTALRSRFWMTHGGAGVGPAARTLPPSSSRAAPRSRVQTTHGSTGIGPAARAFPPSSSYTATLSHVCMTRVFGRHTAARASVLQPTCSHLTPESPSHYLLELTHGTPIPRSDDTRTRRRGRRSRSPRSHRTCTIPAGNCSHYAWTSARSRHTLPARPRSIFCVRMTA
ncbi:hypothetical protein B0H14DRAFT_2606721 [Mycena olivaceomarginata]|nr:hypothetical protein B0H14DRAFT_2606721 [Mycena olivaceomarginata]